MGDKLTSGSIATLTGATGLAKWIEMIPDGIGKVACLVGIFCTLIAVIITIRKSVDDRKLVDLEIKKLMLEIADKRGINEPN